MLLVVFFTLRHLPLGVLLHARAERATDAERHLVASGVMILCFAHDVLVLASKPHPLLSNLRAASDLFSVQ